MKFVVIDRPWNHAVYFLRRCICSIFLRIISCISAGVGVPKGTDLPSLFADSPQRETGLHMGITPTPVVVRIFSALVVFILIFLTGFGLRDLPLRLPATRFFGMLSPPIRFYEEPPPAKQVVLAHSKNSRENAGAFTRPRSGRYSAFSR